MYLDTGPHHESTSPKVGSVSACAVVSEVNPRECDGAQCPGAGGRKTYLRGARCGACRETKIHFLGDGVGAKVAKDLGGGKDDDRTEHDVEQRLGAVLRDMPKKSDPDWLRTQNPVRDMLAPRLHPRRDVGLTTAA